MKKLFTFAIATLIFCLVIVITSLNKEIQKKNTQIETLQNQVDYLRFCKFIKNNCENVCKFNIYDYLCNVYMT